MLPTMNHSPVKSRAKRAAKPGSKLSKTRANLVAALAGLKAQCAAPKAAPFTVGTVSQADDYWQAEVIDHGNQSVIFAFVIGETEQDARDKAAFAALALSSSPVGSQVPDYSGLITFTKERVSQLEHRQAHDSSFDSDDRAELNEAHAALKAAGAA